MPRKTTIRISSNALASNLRTIKNYANKSKVWSVIKSNAYGHTIKAALKGLKETSGFAVLELNEAVLLRENGWNGPILLLEGFFEESDLLEICQYKITTVIHNDWQLNYIKQYDIKSPIDVYLKLNSGMNRLGFNEKDFIRTWYDLSNLKKISSLTLMSHFSLGFSTKTVNKQMNIIRKIFKILNPTLCLANSTAIIFHTYTHKDWIRPGIILYGILPKENKKISKKFNLKPVMTLESRIISIQNIKSKEYIGYGKNYYSNKSNLIGIVSCGYADGYPFSVPFSGTPVFVNGTRTQIIGSVCMDMLTIDLNDCPNAKIGSKVELWGNNISINEISKLANTTSYELMCRISSRVLVKIE
ncbi:dadX [Wigglesworthia glossinidia endosymbiont of Glossina brevipalpis]|uniref:Alanine racemase n=1 Tax=Wigglesworthia glossinidia brevipalpis TaxID=36870 RepID=ALR_WIGBR|nr:RecName: Full=Alanine racemase [Wigglesworthia glossinidia endosymbiont of Glossina brevipalpis]BAC24522.1 dadX [Wigglesworthia glossinidia endosymbiont of Glossina brevipalpis]